MDSLALDPYEQQLLTVFNSCGPDHCGSLDRDGLTQLCQALHLEEQSRDLIESLLKDPKHSRATFNEFKQALLNLLDNMQLNKHKESEEVSNKIENGSPDREVSPKFIYGSKKYGRRSRPKCDDVNTVDEQNDLNYLNKSKNVLVQRSNSQSEVCNSKKRKTNYKLKRCTSLPGTNRVVDTNFVANDLNSSPEINYSEEMLREAWRKLGVGKDGYLNQSELALVCDAIGLHQLAKGVIRQLSSKLTLNYDHKISFQELLEALQVDETWSDVLNASPIHEITSISNEIFPDSRTFQYVTLGPDGNGFVTADSLIEIWEQIGICSPKELIHELGFNERNINIVDLASVLEKEIKGIHDITREEAQNPHVALLYANLTLYQTEIKCLKSILEQLHAEKEKLKCDVAEANNRANLLAQEVDDNHSKMERSSQHQVKLIEHRHADILKQITEQYTNDKEHLSVLNQNLEEKIFNLEQEVNKLRNDMMVSQKYSGSLEKENQSLSTQVAELQEVKVVLTDKISALQDDRQKHVELEQEQIEPLLSKLSNLQIENAQLRDRNDEMVTEIENLTCQVSNMRSKLVNTPTYADQSMEENISVICEGVGLGSKRRSDYSPTKDTILFGIANESPRLGKFRKFQKDREETPVEVVPFTSNESGFEAEIDTFDLTSTPVSAREQQDIKRLQAKISFLEQVLAKHSISVPNEDEWGVHQNEDSLIARILELEKIFGDLSEVSKMLNKNGIDCDSSKVITTKLETILKRADQTRNLLESNVGAAEGDSTSQLYEKTVKKYEEENKQLQDKCTELENCIELLRNEYEKCEDYWQSKLDEERQIFDQEQMQSNEKLADLINKMSEYEEQFANQDETDTRLPTIEETYNLEQQFTDLEQEYEHYKASSENELFKRDEEIAILKDKLMELTKNQAGNEMGVQVNAFDENARLSVKMGSLSVCMVESTNLFSADAMPVSWTPVEQMKKCESDGSFVWNKEQQTDENCFLSWSNGQPSTSNSSTLEKNSAPCRPKRTRKHDRNNYLYKKNNQDVKKSEENDEKFVTLPASTVHGLKGRLHHLEQRCRQLQIVLKQQHFYTEQTLQQYMQQHRGEKVQLQCMLRNHQESLEQQVRICNDQLERLARSDMLVKELYVENSYLIAKVQRLEQQCHILAQYNANSTSV